MPNRFGRQVPVSDYKPRGLLPEGLANVPRPGGEDLASAAATFTHVGNTFGAIADEAARLEGEAAGKVAGLDPSYRPGEQSNLTVRGKAFNEAALSTYKNNLDAKIRTDMQAVFEANKNNPAELKKAFDALGQVYNKDHVFDEVRGEFNAAFVRMRLPYENKALSNLESDQKDRAKATLIDNLTVGQTNLARMSAVDPANPKMDVIVGGELKRLDDLVDQAVKDEALTAEQAAKLKWANRNTATSRAATATAEALKTSEDVAAFRERLSQQFASGKMPNLTADGWDSLRGELVTIENRKRTTANADTSLLEKSIKDYVDRTVDGFPVSPDEWTRLAISPGAQGARGKAALEDGEAKLKIAQAMRGLSIEDASRFAAKLRGEIGKDGAVTSRQAIAARFADDLVDAQRKALDTDQLGLAEKKRLVPAIVPLDFQGFAASNDPASAATLALQFRARTAQARAIGSEFSRAPQFLRPDERERLKEIADQGGDKALELAGAIVKGADQDAPSILREIAGDAPLLAQAGTIIAQGGSMTAARDALQAARIKKETGKELAGVPALTTQKLQRDEFGPAFALQGEAGGLIRSAADAIAKTRVDRAGADPKGAEAENIYRKALQEAAGAVFIDGVQYGGVASYKPGWFVNYKVPVPTGVRASDFRDVIRAVTEEDLAKLQFPPQTPDGKSYAARDIAAAIPVAVRGGYRFAMGDPASNDPQYIRGADGRPFVLPFDELENELRRRVPGAFLGGR